MATRLLRIVGFRGGSSCVCLHLGALAARSTGSTLIQRSLVPMSGRAFTGGGSGVKGSLEQLLRSQVTVRLANTMWMGVGATLLYYVWRRKGKSSQPNTQAGRRESGAMENRFSQKVVLITGGAGDIGSATAQAFAREGASVILIDLPQMEKVLQARCVDLEAQGAAKALFVTADVSKEEDVEKMTQFAVEKAGRIDCFFNNAGIQGDLQPLHKHNNDLFLKMLKVNTYGVFLGLKYVGKAMMETGNGGVIVNTASLAGLIGPRNGGAYVASKFAVAGMTKTAAKDFAPYGIRVCAIAPGIVEGKMASNSFKSVADRLKEARGEEGPATEEEVQGVKDAFINSIPQKRPGKPSEVAAVVLFLCSDEASYLTGNIVPIDGGRLE